jgi:transcriptional regulator with XRE-family HTH domain
MTQTRAAELLIWARTTLIAIERGNQAVSVDQLWDLADLYGTDPAAFFPIVVRRSLVGSEGPDVAVGFAERHPRRTR